MNTNHRKTSRRDFLQAAGTLAAGFALAATPCTSRAAGDPGLKIGFVGSGRLGSVLGGLWLKAGHEVMFSSLDLEHDKALAARLGGKARAGTSKEAAAFADVLVISVPYAALPQVGKDLGSLIQGKVVLDTCNPVVSRDGATATWAREKGVGLASAELLPGARLVRAFNAISSGRLPEIAQRHGERVGMPMAGDDANAIAAVSRLVRDIGLEPVLVGPLAMGKYLMPGTPLAGEHTAAEIKRIAAGLG